METMKKAPRMTNKEDKGEETLDANLWGQLQEHIPLQTIYEKLLQRDLFRLRLVNKEWNHAALQWILPKSSFLTVAQGVVPWGKRVPFLNGIVTYNSASNKFKFSRQHLRLRHIWTHVPPFEVEGLILCHNPDGLKERGVFNVHTQTWHAIPASPKQSEALFACGLLVDTTVRPYTFKLVEGHQNFRTQIYDSKSKSWSITSSRLPPSSATYSRLFTLEYSCVCQNNNIYMSLGKHMILKYSLEDDKWMELKLPKEWDFWDNSSLTLGVWASKIFTTAEDNEQKVMVWELVESKGQKWVEYARMPKEQYEWLWNCDFDSFGSYEDSETCLKSFFCDGYMLVCCWRWTKACAEMLALFNIATKSWQNVNMPKGTVAAIKPIY